MALINNKITIFLHEEKFTTPTMLAKKLGLSAVSLRNTFYGVKPIIKVVIKLYQKEREIFDMLPQNSKDLLPKKFKETKEEMSWNYQMQNL